MCDILFIHPCGHLEEFLDDIDITHAQFAAALDVAPEIISQVMKRRAPITADLALRIGKAFSTDAEMWLNLQQIYDIEVARATVDVSAIEPLYDPLPDEWTPPWNQRMTRKDAMPPPKAWRQPEIRQERKA